VSCDRCGCACRTASALTPPSPPPFDFQFADRPPLTAPLWNGEIEIVVDPYLPADRIVAIGEPTAEEAREMEGMSDEDRFVYLAQKGRVFVGKGFKP
jgi:hypothetical protein